MRETDSADIEFLRIFIGIEDMGSELEAGSESEEEEAGSEAEEEADIEFLRIFIGIEVVADGPHNKLIRISLFTIYIALLSQKIKLFSWSKTKPRGFNRLIAVD